MNLNCSSQMQNKQKENDNKIKLTALIVVKKKKKEIEWSAHDERVAGTKNVNHSLSFCISPKSLMRETYF